MRLAIFSQGGTLALLYLHLESLFYGVRNVSRIRRKGPLLLLDCQSGGLHSIFINLASLRWRFCTV